MVYGRSCVYFFVVNSECSVLTFYKTELVISTRGVATLWPVLPAFTCPHSIRVFRSEARVESCPFDDRTNFFAQTLSHPALIRFELDISFDADIAVTRSLIPAAASQLFEKKGHLRFPRDG